MNRVLVIAKEEFRYWLRSKLALAIVITGLVLLSFSILLTTERMSHATHERTHMQAESDQAFLSQPARHPHRMVHYGHYVFRKPSTLSMIDPGLDAYTGQSIFLEGHRQNSAMFAQRQAASGLANFGSLSPALLLQILAPFMLILLGYNSFTREREQQTYAQIIALGLSPFQVLVSKGCALLGAAGLIMLPLIIASSVAVALGEPVLTAGLFVLGYAVYLAVWCVLISIVSFLAHNRSTSLGSLVCVWIALSLFVPPIAASLAKERVDAPGKLESDFAILKAAKEAGDGHNTADPAFNALRANILAQYDVGRVEDLPVNFRGVVAQYAEEKLTKILNEYAEERMDAEVEQARLARSFGWISPTMSIREFSMIVASVDLGTHHRFLREAEDVRFNFVQSLNEAHETQLTYKDDINRSTDSDSEQRTRIDPKNWQVLDRFEFQAAPAIMRSQDSLPSMVRLIVWLIILSVLCYLVSSRRVA